MPVFEKEETWEQSEIQELQMNRLKETLDRVYRNVPFYREAFDNLNISPSDIESLSDLKRLPFTKKHDFRENYPFNLFATPLNEVIRIHGSSGTSGKPTIVGYTKNDIENWSDMVARAIYMAGGRKEDVLHNAYGYGLFTGGLGLHHGAERLGCATVPVSGGNTSRQITLIQDLKPRIICATPSYVLNISEAMKEMDIDPRTTSLKYAILGAEPWSEELRHVIQETFDMKAMDIYGLSEVMGPGVAIECVESQNGLHIADDHFIVEIIDPETLLPVPDGEDGELVFTSLTKEALPVIRYRTGDISSISREKCECGRTTTKMSRIKGRIDNMLIIRGVNVFPSEIERSILPIRELDSNYQIHLYKKGALDHAELHVEVSEAFYRSLPDKDFNHLSAQKLIKKIQRMLKTDILVSMNVSLKKPQSIPRSDGKAKRIVDRRSEKVTSSN
ncbi:phenylacetate--CoA ligase [Salipaludibacillus keqinensis]|uniref:Phenylacetate-coenzyme A ligase n=1 Tax=Salipaludibacillus keqinensis TaxID=2045207 RepID=A0A323TQS4_9BACI|nr:phenylacetate--CoA ligase PaaK [Salipaludibacillus keqinensis]PYZ94853.1 phenylacetate--CoA ligase [Salipaludibacillus keqinensis]